MFKFHFQFVNFLFTLNQSEDFLFFSYFASWFKISFYHDDGFQQLILMCVKEISLNFHFCVVHEIDVNQTYI